MAGLRIDGEKRRWIGSGKRPGGRKGGLWAALNSEQLRWWISTLAIPAMLGYAAHEYQVLETARADKAHEDAENRAQVDRRLTLYTELLSKREQEDTEVRRGIFDKVLEKYLQPSSQNVENKIVALELMSANFHESLDLSPLFWQLDRLVSADPNATARKAHLGTLARIASDVKSKQLEALALAGDRRDLELDLAQISGEATTSESFNLQFTDPSGAPRKRRFSIDVIEPDFHQRRVRIQVRVDHRPESATSALDVLLWADLYDFPMVSFTRISATERIAVVLQSVEPAVAKARVTFIYYPSARSGVKDKPFIDEVLADLVKPASSPK